MTKIDKRKRQLLKASGAGLLAGGLAGCLGGGSGGSETTTEADDGTTEAGGETTDSGTTTTASDPLNVGMVYSTGGLGDNSFNDMAHKGIKRAKSEFGVTFKNAEPSSPSDIASLQRRFAQSGKYDLISCIGVGQKTALTKNAKQFSDQKFLVVDAVVDQSNVTSYTFKEHQGSFQVGHLAGLLTQRDFSAGAGQTTDAASVGFVGGKEIPLIKKFEAGFKAGAKHAGSDVEFRSAYAGTWSDPGQGQSIANSMYNNGADIVYHAAGGTGNGVFKAAQKQGRFAIGVDADQSKTLPDFSDVILASMVKQVDEAVYRAVENTANGNFDGGSSHSLGLKEGGVKAIYGQELGSEIPKEVKSKLESSREKIVAGDIEVPTDPSNA